MLLGQLKLVIKSMIDRYYMLVCYVTGPQTVDIHRIVLSWKWVYFETADGLLAMGV